MIKRIEPGPGQESVWDYPRPPRVEPSAEHVVVTFGGQVLAETRQAFRVLETSHPPVYYIPPAHVLMQYLQPTARQTFCEFKGMAAYWTISVGEKVAQNAAWGYPSPNPRYTAITDYVAFYPSLMDACTVDGEAVQPQPGDFYGGWITRRVVGPFKGGPGSMGW